MYKPYKTTHILNTRKHCDGGWFWNKYSAQPYIGCEWGCVYCYCRDEKYNPYTVSDPEVSRFDDPFSQYIKVKENAPELLKKALRNKPRDILYLDSYQPIEMKFEYVRKMLEICHELAFPVFINEKSPMLLHDLDILEKIHDASYLNVGWSIITAEDDKTREMFEPHAPEIDLRFDVMKTVAEHGISTGTVFTPMLPFIYDTEENIDAVIRKTKECGGQYVLDGGLTLDGYCGTYFYRALEKYDPALVKKYKKLYSDSRALAEHRANVHQKVLDYCKKYDMDPYIPRPVEFFPKHQQVNKKIAEIFYLKARELQISGGNSHREWAYRRAAWTIDDLEENLEDIYENKGMKGLMEIEHIGKSISKRIAKFLTEWNGEEP